MTRPDLIDNRHAPALRGDPILHRQVRHYEREARKSERWQRRADVAFAALILLVAGFIATLAGVGVL